MQDNNEFGIEFAERCTKVMQKQDNPFAFDGKKRVAGHKIARCFGCMCMCERYFVYVCIFALQWFSNNAFQSTAVGSSIHKFNEGRFSWPYRTLPVDISTKCACSSHTIKISIFSPKHTFCVTVFNLFSSNNVDNGLLHVPLIQNKFFFLLNLIVYCVLFYGRHKSRCAA